VTVISPSLPVAVLSKSPGGAAVLTSGVDFAAVLGVEMSVDIPGAPAVCENIAVVPKAVALSTAAVIGKVEGQIADEPETEAPGLDLPDDTRRIGAPADRADVQPLNVVADIAVMVMAVLPKPAPIPTAVNAKTADEPRSSAQVPAEGRVTLSLFKMSSPAVAKVRTPGKIAEPVTVARTLEVPVALDLPFAGTEHGATRVPVHFAPPVEGGGGPPAAISPTSAPVERLLAALAHKEPAERQWLDTVIRDVASVAGGKSGEVRFRVEPDGYGRMTVERTAERLEISVSEPRSMIIAEAARPQVLAGAAALGVPVAAATVVFDQSSQRGREDARPRQNIEHRDAEEARESGSADSGRYA
jgi:hypothetical protein